jgi:hypothetical protein
MCLGKRPSSLNLSSLLPCLSPSFAYNLGVTDPRKGREAFVFLTGYAMPTTNMTMTQSSTDLVNQITNELEGKTSFSVQEFHGNVLVAFDGKPDEAVRKILKGNEFYWENRSMLWMNSLGKNPYPYRGKKKWRKQPSNPTQPAPSSSVPREIESDGLPSLSDALSILNSI